MDEIVRLMSVVWKINLKHILFSLYFAPETD
jgi:hypothetical protein